VPAITALNTADTRLPLLKSVFLGVTVYIAYESVATIALNAPERKMNDWNMRAAFIGCPKKEMRHLYAVLVHGDASRYANNGTRLP
jgi:hypothetical protein